MTMLDEFKNSEAWDRRYNLPLVPKYNNPWLYGALAEKIICQEFSQIIYSVHFDACAVYDYRGLIWRWPDRGGGNISYDELIGVASVSDLAAARVLQYLSENFGRYNNVDPSDKSFKHWMYRFPLMMAFLKARATGSPGFWRFGYTLTILLDALMHRSGDEEGRLRIWLTLDTMECCFGCKLALRFWRSRMRKKGLSPKSCFAISFKDIPVFSKWAPESF